jgi:hypothetical protein
MVSKEEISTHEDLIVMSVLDGYKTLNKEG